MFYFKLVSLFFNVNAIYYVFFIRCMHRYDRNYIYLGDHEIKNETPGKKMYPDKKKINYLSIKGVHILYVHGKMAELYIFTSKYYP